MLNTIVTADPVCRFEGFNCYLFNSYIRLLYVGYKRILLTFRCF